MKTLTNWPRITLGLCLLSACLSSALADSVVVFNFFVAWRSSATRPTVSITGVIDALQQVMRNN